MTLTAFAAELAGNSGTQGARPIRLDTLVRLRWLAIAGQTASLVFVAYALGFPTPIAECLALIVLSVLINVGLFVRFGAGHRPSVNLATALLIYDSVQLAGLLWLTGGLLNPFSILLVAPVSVSATTLPQRSTLTLAITASVLVSILSVSHLDLPWYPDRPLDIDRVYVIGIWVALLCGIAFIAAYTNRVAHEARQLADALTATELTLSRQQHLRALDGLAAAAAHELGTPLSTIVLAAKEMRSDVPAGPLAEDVDLIISQAQRCRAILGKLRNLGADAGDPFAAVLLSELIAEAANPYEGHGKAVEIAAGNREGPEPVFTRQVGLLYGLGNLIENAARYARQQVTVETGWNPQSVTVVITDDGPGFPPDLVTRLGDPYLTTRPGRPGDEDSTGLGLGIFIAKTLLERTGARVAFANSDLTGSAEISISWKRDAIRMAQSGAAE